MNHKHVWPDYDHPGIILPSACFCMGGQLGLASKLISRWQTKIKNWGYHLYGHRKVAGFPFVLRKY